MAMHVGLDLDLRVRVLCPATTDSHYKPLTALASLGSQTPSNHHDETR